MRANMELQSRGNRGDVMYSYTYRIPKPWNGFFIIKKAPCVIFVLPGLHIEKSSAWRVNFLCLCVEDLDFWILQRRSTVPGLQGSEPWSEKLFRLFMPTADKDSHTHSVLLKATNRMAAVCQQNVFELHRHESLPRWEGSLTEGFF